VNTATGNRHAIVQLPASRRAIIDAGGLIAYARKRVLERTQAATH
jgi:hypothetical protein